MENQTIATQELDLTGQDELFQKVTSRLAEVESALGLMKKLYEEKEQLTLQLKQLVGVEQEVVVGDMIIKVVDNFAEKNTVFKAAAVKRYDLEVDSLYARQIKADKEAEKAAKKAKK